ncbi:hypothetical protein FNF27_00279 [Cafeteria roenbergensis]|uniref:S1 motif domain-containing protein n=1 Tax=Cafeteria roenbergensis TaxID=33653 RepID=A0A5A8EQY8_CAFRO|nr:hypothetical protein FNF27_00279 [Cafeteria roenbergensis]
MTVMGVVRGVSFGAVSVSLPHGLVGSVPATATNDVIAARWSATRAAKAAAAAAAGSSSSSSRARGSRSRSEADDSACRAILEEAFPVGMVLRTAVTQVGRAGVAGAKKADKTIKLSLRPELVASGLELQHVGQGVTLSCSIRAIEDHGYEVDTGIEGLKAFMPFKACDGTDGQGHPLVEGSVIACAVVTSCEIDADRGAGTCKLAINSTVARRPVRMAPKAAAGLAGGSKAAADTPLCPPTAPLGTTSLRAGDRLGVIVKRVLPNGLLVQLDGRGSLSSLFGTVSLPHLRDPATAFWSKRYSKGDRLVGRVLYASPAEKRIAITLAPHLVELRKPPCMGVEEAVFGAVIHGATVTKVDDKLGVSIAWPASGSSAAAAGDDDDDDEDDDEGDEAAATLGKGKNNPEQGKTKAVARALRKLVRWGRVGFAHVSRLADERTSNPTESFRVGTAGHDVRVVGMSECDGIVNVSLAPSVVKAGVISAAQLSPGDIVDGIVAEDAMRGKSVVLRIGGRARGVVTPLHIGDSASNPTKEQKNSAAASRPRFRKGQALKARVLAPAQHGTVYLTLKPSLVQMGKLPVVSSYEAAAEIAAGLRDARLAASSGETAKAAARQAGVTATRGFITALDDARGLVVTLFGGVYGSVSAASIKQRGLLGTSGSVSSVFRVGQVVDVVIMRADAKRRRLVLELADKSGKAPAAASLGTAGVAYADPKWAAAVAKGEVLSGRAVAADALLAGKRELCTALDEGEDVPILFEWAVSPERSLWAELPDCCLSDDPLIAARLAATIRESGVDGVKLQGVLPLFSRSKALVCRFEDEATSGTDGGLVHAWAVVARKPTLVKVAQGEHKSGPTLPRSVSDAKPGRIVAGIVSGHSAAGVFVLFAGRVSGLVPKARIVDGLADEPEALFPVGKTILAVVEAVNEKGGRIVLDARGSTLSHCAARSPASVLELETAALRGLVSDEDSAAALSAALGGSDSDDEGSDSDDDEAEEDDDDDADDEADAAESPEPAADEEDAATEDEAAGEDEDEEEDEDEDEPSVSRQSLAPGAVVSGRIIRSAGAQGTVVTLDGGDAAGATGFALACNDSAGGEEGDAVTCLVLDVDAITGIVDVAIVPSTKASPSKAPKPGQRVEARVVVVKPGRYAVLAVAADAWPTASALVAFMPLLHPSVRGGSSAVALGDTITTVVAAKPEAAGGEWTSRSALVLSHLCRAQPDAAASSSSAAASAPPRRQRSDSTGSLTGALGTTSGGLLQTGQVVAATVLGFAPPEASAACGALHTRDAAATNCDVMLKLRHVKGKVRARLALADVVSTRQSGRGDVDAATHWKPGDSLLVRVLSVERSGRTIVARVTARPGDLPRRVVAAVLEASGPTAPPKNVAHLAADASSTSTAPVHEGPLGDEDSPIPFAPFLPCRSKDSLLPAGWIGEGVVEAVGSDFGVVVGFGNGVRGIALPFDACETLAEARKLGTPDSEVMLGDVVRVGVVESLPVVSQRGSTTQPARLVLTLRKSTLDRAREAGGSEAGQLEIILGLQRRLAPGTAVFGCAVRPQVGTGIATLADMARTFAASAGAPEPESSASDIATLRVRVAPRFSATLSAVHATPAGEAKAYPLKSFKDGEWLQATVLEVEESARKSSGDAKPESGKAAHAKVPGKTWSAAVTLRASAVRGPAALEAEEAAEDAAALKDGAVVRAFVNGVSRKGCFLQLSRRVSGRVLVSDLSDAFVNDPAAAFPVGSLVTGVVKRAHADRNQCDVSLRASDLRTAGVSDAVETWAVPSLSVGDVLTGRVAKVTDFGLFVSLPGGVRGLCHKANLSFKADAGARKAKKRSSSKSRALMQPEDFSEGDPVTVQVTKLNMETRKISLTMRVGDAAATKRAREDDPPANPAKRSRATEAAAKELSDADGTEDEEGAEDSEEESEGGDEAEESDEDEEESGDDEDEEESGDEEDEKFRPGAPRPRFGLASKALTAGTQRGRGMSVGSTDEASAPASLAAFQAADDSDSDGDDDDDAAVGATSSSSAAAAAASGKSAHMSRAERERLEAQAAAREAAIADGTAAPTSEADFERLLAGSPNSSVLWIRFMAFFLGTGDVDRARATGEKALTQIHFRDEQERLNLWVALLNLEATYGTPETLGATFARASRANDPLKTHRAMLDVFKSLGRQAEADALYRVTLKKFKQDVQTWRDFCNFQLQSGRGDEARATFKEALEAIPAREGTSFTKDFAVLEYKKGSPARGRTMFEDLVASHPRKLDLWLVYADQEAGQGAVSIVRGIFERLVSGGGLSSKKMRSVFKKWVQFEAEHGDEAGIAAVKRRVAEYARKAI